MKEASLDGLQDKQLLLSPTLDPQVQASHSRSQSALLLPTRHCKGPVWVLRTRAHEPGLCWEPQGVCRHIPGLGPGQALVLKPGCCCALQAVTGDVGKY